LKYKTLRLGRTVYGGGGIMPDVFVPYDTTGINRYVLRAINGGLLSAFYYDYSDKHRSEFAANDFVDFNARWEKKEKAVFDEMVAFFEEKGLKAEDDEELTVATPVLKTRLKALLARSVLGTTAYWQVINSEMDPAFQEALRIVKNWSGDFPDLP
jgi:carboxyl-terminal processing protease